MHVVFTIFSFFFSSSLTRPSFILILIILFLFPFFFFFSLISPQEWFPFPGSRPKRVLGKFSPQKQGPPALQISSLLNHLLSPPSDHISPNRLSFLPNPNSTFLFKMDPRSRACYNCAFLIPWSPVAFFSQLAYDPHNARKRENSQVKAI